MANKKSSKRRREAVGTGVKPFEDAEDVNEDTNNNDDEDGEDKDVATNKAKKRQAEEDAIEDDATDESDDDDDEEDDDEEDVDVGFAPFIIHEDMEWDLVSVVDESEPGETLFFYRAPTEDSPTARWYKLEVIEVGEVPAATKK